MKIKAFDTAVTFTDTLMLGGSAVNLDGAAVLFILERNGTVFSAPATIVTPASGAVSYQPSAGFPTAAGDYRQEWEVTFPDSTKLTFPGDAYNKVTIIADLNAA